MKINSCGLITNEFNDILLWQQADQRWASPGGALAAAGQLPAAHLAELVHDQTGLRVLPIRLVGLYTTAEDTLTLMFRCLQKGGSKHESGAQFFPLGNLPPTLDPQQAHILSQASKHPGGAPDLADLTANHTAGALAPLRSLWQKLQGATPTPEPAHEWQIDVLLLMTTAESDIVALADGATLALPSAPEPPWDTAVRLAQTLTKQAISPPRVSSIYVAQHQPQMTFVFTAVVPTAPTHTAVFPLNQLPPTLPPIHRQAIADYISRDRDTVFRQI